MAPTFKKPQEYDPNLAASTLARAFEHSNEAKHLKKQHMLAELGLGDEAIDIDDDEEDEDDEMGDEDDEQPIFSNGGKKDGASGSNNRSTKAYGYRDVFGREYQRQRNQQIDSKGYDRYLTDLMDRAQEGLQLLRSDNKMQYPGSAEVIGELEYELSQLHQENKDLRSAAASASPMMSPSGPTRGSSGDDTGATAQLEGDVRTLRDQVIGLERLVQAKDASIRDLQQQLRHARDGLVAATSNGSSAGNNQVEQLQGVLSVKEAQLAKALAEIKDLKNSGARAASALMSEDGQAQLEAAQRERDDISRRADELQKQLSEAQAEARRQEGEFSRKLAEMSQASEHDQNQALQKQVWALTEQHSRQMEEVQAELKQKGVIIKELQAAKSDAARKVEEMSNKVKQAKSSAAMEVSSKLDGMYKVIDEVHRLRESVLAELVAMQSEMFSDKAIKEMARQVRDKEIDAVRKVRADSSKQIEDALQRARDAEEEAAAQVARHVEQARIQTLEAQGMIKHFQDKWRVEFDKRKKLHNMVLELKGNIRVLCRVRPLVDKEMAQAGGEEAPVRVLNEEVLRVPTGQQGDKDFEFDRVFAPVDDQDAVFDEVRALVTSALDGYNVSIMAYGQTGSGKTHTMEGPDSNPGVNSRSLAELFKLAGERSDEFEYSFTASILEIYNEQIFDLLAGGRDQEDKLDVKQDTDGRMHVPGLLVEEVNNVGEVANVINRGRRNRSTFATNMNEHSSRSHLVFSVYITGKSKTSNVIMRGKLHLIDLAGSERIARTNAQGDRLKEAQAINKSLSALGDVIQALQQRNAHIPYRNSKLTRLLEDSLGNNSKCVMVVNVSPAHENVPETKCSLEFASRARKVELGKAKANVEGGGSGTPKAGRTPAGGNTPRYGTPLRN